MPYRLDIPNDSKVYRYMSKIYSVEASNVSNPCYLPKLVKYYADIKKITNIDEYKIKEFKDGIDPKYRFNIYTDKYTCLLMIAMLYYTRRGKYDLAKIFFQFLGIKFYSSRLHTHFPKFCNQDIWVITFDRLSPKHLFKVKNGIPNAIYYLGEEVFNRNRVKLSREDLEDKDLVAIVYSLRTRIFQSVRSFAELYYKISEEKLKKDYSDSEQSAEAEAVSVISEKISMMMCSYGQIDKDALNKSIIKTGFRKELAKAIVSQVSNHEYKDKVKFIIILIGRTSDLKGVCVDRSRTLMLRRMNSNTKIMGKYIIKNEIEELLHSLEIGHTLKTTYNGTIIQFFSQYLTLFMRNRIC